MSWLVPAQYVSTGHPRAVHGCLIDIPPEWAGRHVYYHVPLQAHHETWTEELGVMLELGYKAELEALETLSPMLQDLLLRDDYLK